MTAEGPADPRLVVLNGGPFSGRRYSLRRGAPMLVGRGAEADLLLDSADLSRRHAWVRWDGATASIVDAGSRNGTAVNDRPLEAAYELRHGDVIRLGSLELRYESPGRAGHEPTATHGAYPAHRVRNEMSGTAHGHVQQAGGDIHNQSWTDFRLDIPDPMDEIFQGRGLGVVVMLLGLVVALAGFAGWMYLIFHGGQIDDPGYSPFNEQLAGLPAPMVAFGAFFTGGVLASIGMGMSRAARRRDEERNRRSARRWG